MFLGDRHFCRAVFEVPVALQGQHWVEEPSTCNRCLPTWLQNLDLNQGPPGYEPGELTKLLHSATLHSCIRSDTLLFMLPLFTEEEYQSCKFERLLPLQCEHCDQTFLAKKKKVWEARNSPRTKTQVRFCSRKCAFANTETYVVISCSWCSVPILKRPRSQIGPSGRAFCTQSCGAKYNNRNKTHGTRVSKLENYLQRRLDQTFPFLEVWKNTLKPIGLELDLYFPTLKTAIEINGFHHYNAVFGETKFKRIQELDQEKVERCAKAGIHLIVLNTRHLKHFKVHEAEAVFAQIKSLALSSIGKELNLHDTLAPNEVACH